MTEIFEEMKKRIPNHPKLKKELENLINKGMSEEEALNMMIVSWLSGNLK